MTEVCVFVWLCVCVCVCGGKMIAHMLTHEREEAVQALEAGCGWGSRGAGAARAQRLFVFQTAFWSQECTFRPQPWASHCKQCTQCQLRLASADAAGATPRSQLVENDGYGELNTSGVHPLFPAAQRMGRLCAATEGFLFYTLMSSLFHMK